jgi:putative component of membrane protein insertase Oxa1/YidC/SpoIIIJ protein YidD
MENSFNDFIILIFIILISSISLFAQSENSKWGKADYSYEMPDKFEHRDYTFNEKNPEKFVLKSVLNAYWFFISDVDGDNCSFNPTCSHFFLLSVKETNILQGSLMFFDRFTRDMDIFGKIDHYPSVPDGHFYDPPSLYMLKKDSIQYIPPSVVVKNE